MAIPDSFGRDKFMPGYDPLNFTKPEPVSGHCVTDKELDRSWEAAHGEA